MNTSTVPLAIITLAIISMAIMYIVGSFFGGLPTATFSQNVGIVILTKVVNRVVLGLAAILIICAGLVPKFAQRLQQFLPVYLEALQFLYLL